MSASAFCVVFAGNLRTVSTFVVAFGTLSRPSRAVVETSVRIHHRPAGGIAFNGRVELRWVIRREQICDFVHVVEVNAVFRDRITVSLEGGLPAACNSLRSVSHCLSVSSSFVLSLQGTGFANLSRSAAVCFAVLDRISVSNTLRISQPDDCPRRAGMATFCRRC